MKKATKSNTEIRRTFAKKSFGQNFLTDESYISKIIAALDPQIGETIIEIGAGRGALTEKLIESGANVIAVELEREMIFVLKEKFANRENFSLIEQDALKVDFQEISANPKSFRLVANLPFYISTAILQKLIAQRNCFSEMILMFQREVAERIIAQPGNSARGFLSVLAQNYLHTEILFDVPPDAFQPAPKVWSSIMRLITIDKTQFNLENEILFQAIVSAGFSQKRKTIFNNLKNAAPELRKKFGDIRQLLENCRIAPERRAETLTIAEWQCLTDGARTEMSALPEENENNSQ